MPVHSVDIDENVNLNPTVDVDVVEGWEPRVVFATVAERALGSAATHVIPASTANATVLRMLACRHGVASVVQVNVNGGVHVQVQVNVLSW